MEPALLGILGIIFVLIFIFIGVPMPVVFFITGFFGMLLLKGWGPTLILLKRVPYSQLDDFNLSVIPLFLLLGLVLFECGIGEEIFRGLQRWLGHFRGGMGAAVSVACAFLGTVTGFSFAANVLMCKVAYPEMKRIKYDPALSLAVCASSASVAMMIPPSTHIVVYAIITEQSIAQCLLAGVIPGFLSMAIYAAMILIRIRLNPKLGPPAPRATWPERFVGLKYLLPPVIIMVTIIGGIYFGIFTATEAAGVAALVAFIIVISLRRLDRTRLKSILYETVRLTIMITVILVTVQGFYNLFLNITWLPQSIADLAFKMPSPWLVLAAMYLICFILGMVTGDPMGLVIVPLFTPVVEQLGFNPVWFIITVIKMMEMGSITPPVAFGVFISQGIIKEVSLGKAFKAVWWFVACDAITLLLFIVFPQIVMFLPNTMK